jgi:hypothetical protein
MVSSDRASTALCASTYGGLAINFPHQVNLGPEFGPTERKPLYAIMYTPDVSRTVLMNKIFESFALHSLFMGDNDS